MNYASLFCGAGIADMALPIPQAVVDFDPWGLLAYRLNHAPGTTLVQADLSIAPTKEVVDRMELRGDLDVLTAGSACQGFSVARGIDRPRHALLRALYYRVF